MLKRPKRLRILRLAASALAAFGLLGHGLAMLLVAVLAQTPAAAAQGGIQGFGEICRANSADLLAGRQAPSPDRPHDHDGDHQGGHLKGCPVCTAFAQSGAADLPHALVLPLGNRGRMLLPTATELPPADSGWERPRTRAPPAAA
ncbi:MAG: DUF2946 family protein [Kiloniellaceae bacterium]